MGIITDKSVSVKGEMKSFLDFFKRHLTDGTDCGIVTYGVKRRRACPLSPAAFAQRVNTVKKHVCFLLLCRKRGQSLPAFYNFQMEVLCHRKQGIAGQ